jgi:hypothetical protein
MRWRDRRRSAICLLGTGSAASSSTGKPKARGALDDAFLSATPNDEVLFEVAVTKTWLRQVIVGLTLICRGSYRGVVEFLRDLLGVSISVGTVHHVLEWATQQAGIVNHDQDLSGIRVGLHDLTASPAEPGELPGD